jgi:hypothetical protein
LSEIDVGAGDDFVRGDQVAQALSGKNDDVGMYATRELRGNRLRPRPCEAPDPVVTPMPVARSNSGSSRSYAPEKPPDIRTLTFAGSRVISVTSLR